MKKKLIITLLTAIFVVTFSGSAFAGRNLSVGMNGNDVYALQQVLSAYGYLDAEYDGYFGSVTQMALISLQSDFGLEADGVAGPMTCAMLGIVTNDDDSAYDYSYNGYTSYDTYDDISYDTYSTTTLTPSLYKGMSGSDVYTLQSLLAEYGFFYEELTGYFGDVTEAAVLNFQNAYGLEACGIAGPQTVALLTGAGILYATEDEGETVYSYTSLGQQIVDYAKGFVGVTPYVWAGRSLYSGTDCSGFVHLIFDNFGIYCSPASLAYDGSSFGYIVSAAEAQPGDIAVYGGGQHVGIYAGDGYVVHCSSPENGTVCWKMDYRSDLSWFLRVIG